MTQKTAKFKAFEKSIQIFKVGKHRDSKGNEHDWTLEDLEQMVANYATDTLPYVVGHPATDDPAYGWSAGLYIEDEALYTDHENIDADFEQMVDDGKFRNRSISVAKTEEGTWRLNHIGFLGAVPPAVKGLKPILHADDEPLLTFEFSSVEEAVPSLSWGLSSIGSVLRNIKNRLIESTSLEEAEKEIPEYALESINRATNNLDNIPANQRGHMYSDPDLQNPTGGDMPKDKKPAEGGGNDASTFSQEDVDSQVKAATDKARKEFEHEQACKAFADKLESEGKILPAQIASTALFLASMSADTIITFSEGEGDAAKTTELSQFEAAKAQLDSAPAQYAGLKKEQVTDANSPEKATVSEFAAPDGASVDADRLELDRKAQSFMAANPKTSYLDAVKAVA